jgi:hypothetical protein
MNQMVRTIGLNLVAGLLVTGAGWAQQSTPNRRIDRVPVVIAISDSLLGDSTPVMIVRRANVAPHDVIVVHSDVDRQRLSDVVLELLTIRGITGDTVTRSAMMRLQRGSERQTHARPELPWAQRVVEDLRRAAAMDIPGFGTLPAVQIWLPPQGRGVRRP